MPGILLTDGQQRKTLAAARSLGKKGLEVYIGENIGFALSFYSKYCTSSFVYPCPQSSGERFVTFMLDKVKKYKPDVFFPMDDCAMEITARYISEFEKYTAVPIPNLHTITALGDKASLMQAAIQKGIPCPKTVIINDLAELSTVRKQLDLPVVIKPRRSSGARGVRYIYNERDFIPTYLKVHQVYPFPLVQELIPPGDKYDVCLLFNRHAELRAAFTQKELRQYPLKGGPSTVQESVFRPDLIDLALTVMEGANWYGVAEAEFMIDCRDGLPKLMEVNTRFWASLQTAILAGIDFPHLLYRLAMQGDVEPQFSYRAGVRCRWLLPGDILHFLANPRRWEMDPSFFQSRKDKKIHDDILSSDDPGAVLGFFLGALRCATSPRMWRQVIFR